MCRCMNESFKSLKITATCPTCKGSGKNCPTCKGSGQIALAAKRGKSSQPRDLNRGESTR